MCRNIIFPTQYLLGVYYHVVMTLLLLVDLVLHGTEKFGTLLKIFAFQISIVIIHKYLSFPVVNLWKGLTSENHRSVHRKRKFVRNIMGLRYEEFSWILLHISYLPNRMLIRRLENKNVFICLL